MSFTNRNNFLPLFFFTFFSLSCSTSSFSIFALNFTPELAQKTFHRNSIRLEKKAINSPNDSKALYNASKNLTMYTYGFLMDEAKKISMEDYKEGLKIYNEANSIFKRSILYIEKSIQLDYKDYFAWINNSQPSSIDFKKESSSKLYWAAASYAGAIQSSNGDPNWVVQLPKIGKLLEAGLELYPEWNYGAFYTAMISYSMIRHDASPNKIDTAKYYFNKALEVSGLQDLSPYIAYAENIALYQQNKNEFTNMLYSALRIDINANPDLSLVNYINRSRANWLLDNIDEFFY